MRALTLFDLSAQQGDAEAFSQLGDFYYYQRAGLGAEVGHRVVGGAEAGLQRVVGGGEKLEQTGVGESAVAETGTTTSSSSSISSSSSSSSKRQAASFYQRAADLKHTLAIFNLGIMHEVRECVVCKCVISV